MPQHVTYGAVVALALFIVGWLTGMGGSFIPNLVFSILMGVFAGVLFRYVRRRFGPKEGEDV